MTDLRPAWAQNDPALRHYYDTEWGFPVVTRDGVYERIVLEGFQAGLSWAIILGKREAFRQAFDRFDPTVVATYGQADVRRLMSNSDIVRNERKIRAAITNAKATVALSEQGIDLGELVWSFRPADPTVYAMELPTQSHESRALSAELKSHGFVFVGPVTMHALMEAIGILNHRIPSD